MKSIRPISVLGIFFIAASIASAKSNAIIKKKFHDSNKYDIFIYDHGKITNITTYPSWENIVHFGLSIDEKYLFVLHKPNLQKSNILSVYNLRNKRLIAKIEPNYGGEFRWISGNKIFHTWGCGTNCYSVALYDSLLSNIPLPKMDLDDMSGYYIISPGNKNATFISMHNDNYSIVDFASMTEIKADHFRDADAIEEIKYKNDTVIDIITKDGEDSKTIQIQLNVPRILHLGVRNKQ